MDRKNAWETLLAKLELNSNDFATFTINNIKREPLYFSAKVEGDIIIVDKARFNSNSCKISIKRKVDYSQFEGVYSKYQDYISGVEGVRKFMRDNFGQNTTYIISLIHNLL